MRWSDLCLQPAAALITPTPMPPLLKLLHGIELCTPALWGKKDAIKKCLLRFLHRNVGSFYFRWFSLQQTPGMDANSPEAFERLCPERHIPLPFIHNSLPRFSTFRVCRMSSARLQKRALTACFPPSASFPLPAIIVCRLSGDDQRSGEDLVRGEEADAKTLYLMSLAAALCSPHVPL